MQPEIVEQVIDQGCAALRHQTASLAACLQPVADAAMFARPIDRVAADTSRDRAIHADDRLRVLIGSVLVQDALDEVADVIGRFREVHPRQPFAQVRAVAVDDGEQFLGIAHLEQPQLNPRGHLADKHMPKSPTAPAAARRGP